MSKWNKETTTNEILEGVDLSGVKVLVTGASGGLGEETSRALAAAGASVIMAARDNTKNSEAKLLHGASLLGSSTIVYISNFAHSESSIFPS